MVVLEGRADDYFGYVSHVCDELDCDVGISVMRESNMYSQFRILRTK